MPYSFLLNCILFFAVGSGSFFDEADRFFSLYVKDGLVDYAAIKNDDLLDELVKGIAELDLSNKRVTPEFLKAFYVNAYNILVINQVVDYYPIASPLEVDGFFDKATHEVMGESMTLDHLEKKILYNQFPDPRFHFALVCGAKGCPPLPSEAYQPETIEKQLSERTAEVMNLDWFISVKEKRIEISPLFDWYREDFEKSAGTVRAFINQYREQKIPEKMEISFYEYDWSLNEQ